MDVTDIVGHYLCCAAMGASVNTYICACLNGSMVAQHLYISSLTSLCAPIAVVPAPGMACVQHLKHGWCLLTCCTAGQAAAHRRQPPSRAHSSLHEQPPPHTLQE